MARLKGKRTLITGGTTGIGLETARRFLAEGARVAITGQNPETLAAAKVALPDALVLASDAGDAAAQRRLAGQLETEFGQLDAVFVNAGIGIFQPIEAWDEATFDRLLAVNLKGPYFLLQALAPLLAKPASIVLNTSISAHIGMPTSSVYAASKAALRSLARTASGEWAGRGIRVNAISPGPVTTPIYGKLGLPADALGAMAENIRTQVPMGRFGTPLEVADVAVFLASDESSFMLGAEIVVDGGMSTV